MKDFQAFLNESEQDKVFDDTSIERLKGHVEIAQPGYQAKMQDEYKSDDIYAYDLKVNAKPGRRFARITATVTHKQTGVQLSDKIHCFATPDGKIYKAYNWTNPSATPRGDWIDIEHLNGGKWLYGV